MAGKTQKLGSSTRKGGISVSLLKQWDRPPFHRKLSRSSTTEHLINDLDDETESMLIQSVDFVT